MLVALAAAPAHADLAAERMAVFEQQKWWVGKNLEAGDAFVYEVCDPDAFSGLYGGQPWLERCYHVSLYFVALLLGGAGPEWIVQVVLVGSDGGDGGSSSSGSGRMYDVYNIDAGTMRIDGLHDGRGMANAIQDTIFGLAEFTGNGGKPLVVGESWGATGASSPAAEFLVRGVVTDDSEQEVFHVGYATTFTSVHRIAPGEPFPLGAKVYDRQGVQSGHDRLYEYDLVWRGNFATDGTGTGEWYGVIGGDSNIPGSAQDPGAGYLDLCIFGDAGGWTAGRNAAAGAGPDMERGAPVKAGAAAGKPEASVGVAGDVEYCADLLYFEGYELARQEHAVTAVPGHDVAPESGIAAGDGLFDPTPDAEDALPENARDSGLERFGPFMYGSKPLPEIPAGAVLEDAMPEAPAAGDLTPEGAVPEGAVPETIGGGEDGGDAADRGGDVLAGVTESLGAALGMPGRGDQNGDVLAGVINWMAGILDGAGVAFGDVVKFLEDAGAALDDLAGVFAVQTAHAEPDEAIRRILGVLAGNGTSDDILDGIRAEIPRVQALLQAKNDDGLVLDAGDSVWIPAKMIEGLTYEGMVLLDDAANDPRTITLVSSDQDVLSVEREATVPAGRNSAIFEVAANSGGTARVHATLAGKSMSTGDGTVYEVNTVPFQIVLVAPGSEGFAPDGASLLGDSVLPDIIPFNDDGVVAPFGPARTLTGTDSLPVFIYALDQNGAPADVGADTVLSLGASAGIRVPETATIQAGTDHARIVAGVDRSGAMHAASPGLRPGTLDIDRVADAADVRLAVAPTVIAEGSAAYYYVWLEKDGRPYAPGRVMDVQLVSTDRGVAGFGRAHTDADVAGHENFNTVRDGVVTVQMTDGLARGLVYTGNSGIATLTASVSQYGAASYGVRVGPAGISDAWLCDGMGEEPVVAPGRHNPNNFVAWLMPRVTDSVAYAVVAQYHIADAGNEPGPDFGGPGNDGPLQELAGGELQAQELLARLAPLSLEGSGGTGEAEGCVATPVPFAEQFVTVSSGGGAIHDRTYGTLHRHGISGAAIEFPVRFQTTGEHSIRVTGNEIGAFGETDDLFGSWTNADEWTATVLVANAHADDYSLGITPLPFDSDGTGEVAMVYLKDGHGRVVGLDSLQLRTRDLVLSQAASDFEVSRYSHAFVLTAGLNRTDDVAVSAASIPPASHRLVPADEAVATHVDVPGAVHVGEEFPYAVHEINGNGVPLQLMGAPDVSLGEGIVEGGGGRLVAGYPGEAGTITVIGAGGPVTETVSVGKNKLDFEVGVDADDVRVGQPVLLRLTSDVAGIDYTISWPSWARHEQVGDGVYEIIPEREINGTISVIGEKSGYGTEHGSVSMSVVHEVNVAARAEAGGRPIGVSPEITNAEDGSRIDVPYTGPPVRVHVKYPQDYTTQAGEGYLLVGMEVNGEFLDLPEFEPYLDADARFTGLYERQIFVDIVGADGGGVYRPGDAVRVSAPDREIVPFLIMETFSHWEGDLSGEGRGSLAFMASEDIYAKAVYREVHVWMGIAFAAAAAAAVLAAFRKSDRAKWMFAGLSGFGRTGHKKKSGKAEPAVDDGAGAGRA